MPASCIIPDCNLKYTHSEDVSFHKFPLKHPDLLRQWIQFTEREESWFPTKWSAICSRHFVETDFRECPFRSMLSATAVPSVRKPSEKGFSIDLSLTPAYEPGPTSAEDVPFRDEEYLDGSSITTQCPIADGTDDDVELQEDEIQLTEITCRICGVVFSRPVDNLLFDLTQSVGVVGKYLPFVNLELPYLPRKICLNCSKVVNGFSKFCDNVLRAQTDLEHRFVQGTEGSFAPPTMAPRAPLEKPMKIKQEPVTMLHIKEEKVESAVRQKDHALPCEPLEESAMFAKNQSIAGDQSSLILFNVADERSAGAVTPSLVKQQLRESSKNCEILEIVNLFPPIVDITSATITEVQPYEIKAPPPVVTATSPHADSMPSVQQAAHFMSSLKVEKMTEQENDQDQDYYFRDTFALINTLEEHSYTKLPIQADDNKDEVFHSIIPAARWTDSAAAAAAAGAGEQKNEPALASAGGWTCADCGCRCSGRRRLLCHRTLECPVRRKVAVCCQFCRLKFPSWQRARAHVAMCSKRAARRKRAFDRSKQAPARITMASDVKLHPSQGELVITRYTCSMCDRSYSNSSNLRRHLVTHRPPEQWNHKCGVCFKIFDKLFDLKRHLQFSPCATEDSVPRVINATKPVAERLLYVCSTCNKHFQSYNNLKVHEPIHTGMKAYICETCGKRFAGRTNLWQHRLTHSEERQFRCKLCPKVFKRRGGLTQHVRAFHMKIRPYQCATCGYEYALKADMTRCRHSRLKDSEAG